MEELNYTAREDRNKGTEWKGKARQCKRYNINDTTSHEWHLVIN